MRLLPLLALLLTASASAAIPAAQQATDPQGPGALVLVFLFGFAIAVLLRKNRRLTRRLQQEANLRMTAETALARHRSEFKKQVDDRTNALHQLSFYDPLTDLPNRTLLYERLTHTTNTRQRQENAFALLLIDLNRFKAINDTLGHYVGDSILQEVGIRLQKTVGADQVYYLGGDEFAIMQPLGGVLGDPTDLALRIHASLATPFQAKGLPITLGASIGIAYWPDHTTDADNLLRYAEIAMYSAKRTQDDYAIYDPAQRQDTKTNLVLAGELRQAFAFDTDELIIHYQPKIDFSTGAVSGLEALVRWQHPREGLMAPDQFVLLAEQTGLVRPLTLWVVNAVLRQIATWRRSGIRLPVAINLSALSLHDAYFHEQVAELLESWDVPGELLEFEVTESAAIDDPERAREMLGHLAALGASISIDDFGTGYSSLAYLTGLPIDAIKIDKSFVTAMRHDNDSLAIVRAIVDLGHNLNLRVIAEGIEDQESWRALRHLGCDIGQGYYFSRPLAAEAIGDWLDSLDEHPMTTEFCHSAA